MDSFEYSEQQREEAVRRWLRENGVAVSLGVLCGTGLICGWVLHKSHQNRQAEAASPIFSELLKQGQASEIDQEQVRGLSGKLREEYGSTTYAVLAALVEAKAAVVAEDLEKAGAHLQWVIDNGESPALQNLARLRLTRLHLYDGREAEARRLLKAVPEKMRGSLYHELLGDLLRREDKPAAAREAYQAALEQGIEGRESWLQPKLDAVGVSLEDKAEKQYKDPPGDTAGDTSGGTTGASGHMGEADPGDAGGDADATTAATDA